MCETKIVKVHDFINLHTYKRSIIWFTYAIQMNTL